MLEGVGGINEVGPDGFNVWRHIRKAVIIERSFLPVLRGDVGVEELSFGEDILRKTCEGHCEGEDEPG